jgi:hypothetical protein
MTHFETISCAALGAIRGGARTAATAPTAQSQAVCNRPQFDWMVAHMVPDTGLRPGVQRHVVAHDAQVCGFPMPR